MNRLMLVVPMAVVLLVGSWGWKSSVLGDTPKNTADHRTEEELKGLEHEAVQAMLRADMPAIDRIFADDWIIVDEEAQVRDKKAEFEPYKTGEEKNTAGRLDDMRVRLLGDAAVVTGLYMFKGSFQGKPFDIKGRFTDLCVKRNGRWQIVSSQNTAIPEANATEFPPDSFFIAKEKEDWEALKNKDKAAAARLLADDFVGMYDFGFFTKSEWVKQIDEQYTVDDYTIENAKVLRPSANTALLLYTSNCKGTGTWAEFCSHASRISDLFVERTGQWVALFSQDTQATSSQLLPDDDLSTLALAKEHEILDALNRNDWTAFANLLADDLVAIDEDGIHSKKELLEQIRAAEVRFSDYKMENVKVIPQGNGAIVAYKETLVGTEHGKPFTWHIYTHSHWERRGGKWLMTMFQDSMAKD